MVVFIEGERRGNGGGEGGGFWRGVTVERRSGRGRAAHSVRGSWRQRMGGRREGPRGPDGWGLHAIERGREWLRAAAAGLQWAKTADRARVSSFFLFFFSFLFQNINKYILKILKIMVFIPKLFINKILICEPLLLYYLIGFSL
jgi:hypothetical protein